MRQFDKPATRSKYLVEPVSKELGNEIATEGFKQAAHQKKLAGMSSQQRAGTLRVIFDRMFAKQQAAVEQEGYKLKHGRGPHVNRELYANGDDGH